MILRARWQTPHDSLLLSLVEVGPTDPFFPPWTTQDFTDVYQDHARQLVLAEADGQPVGYAVFGLGGETHGEGNRLLRVDLTVTFERVLVMPGWRRRGIATFLLKMVESYILQHMGMPAPSGILRLLVTVPELSTDVLALFQNLKYLSDRESPISWDHFVHPSNPDRTQDGYCLVRTVSWATPEDFSHSHGNCLT